MKSDLNLSTFDNHLMHGLDFCKKVYDLFERIRKSPGGVDKLEVRRGKNEKKLIEELIPIARYIQARYSPGRRLKVRWFDGGQQYDARLLSSGALVENRVVPKRQCIEVTTVVHANDHLLRRLFSQQGPVFGVKGVSLDRKTKRIVSRPHVYIGREAQDDLTKKILDRIKAKNAIHYPSRTVLVIQCFLETLFLPDEWQYAVQQVQKADIQHRFHEVFVFDSNQRYSATLYGSRPRQRR